MNPKPPPVLKPPPMIEHWRRQPDGWISGIKGAMAAATGLWLLAMLAVALYRREELQYVFDGEYGFMALKVALFYCVAVPSVVYAIAMTCLGVAYFVARPT